MSGRRDGVAIAAMRTALIVGAGIGGLAAGIALRRAGWRARIFERAAAPRELGFALNLAPNAVAALRALGVAGRIEAEAHRTRTVELRRLDGRPLKRLDVAALDAPAPSLMALRQTRPRRAARRDAGRGSRARQRRHRLRAGRRRRACCSPTDVANAATC